MNAVDKRELRLELLGEFLNGKAAEIARAYNAGDRDRVAEIVAEFAA